MNDITVVIPTFNSWKTLKPCIDSIQKQTLKPLEIIVVDNASTDGTSKKVKKYFPKVKVVTLDKNTGVTGGRNAGIRAVSNKASYIFFFDHDMLADSKMLEELLNVAETESGIGIVTPKIYYLSDKHRIWSAGTGINLWTGQVIFRGGKDKGQYETVEEVQVAPAAMLVKMETIKKVKKFDDKYYATYEDTDFCFRAKRAGYKTTYAPKAIAFHDLSTDSKDETDRLLRRAYWVGKNRILFMKDFGKPTFWLFLPLFSIHYLKLAIMNKRMRDGFDFIRGTVSGILH